MKNPLDIVIKTVGEVIDWCIENWIIIGAIVLIVVLFAFRQVIIAILTGK